MGRWMLHQAIIPDAILSSPAMRAQQTIELVCKEISCERASIQWDRRVYLASVKTLLDVITEISPTVNHLLLVGHNPGLEELLLYLCRDEIPRSQTGKLMATATLAQLELHGPDSANGDQLSASSFAPQSAGLLAIDWPKQLPAF